MSLQAREAGKLLSQDVDSLAARLSGSAPSCIDSAQRLAKEVGGVSDVSKLPIMPCSQSADVERLLISGCVHQ